MSQRKKQIIAIGGSGFAKAPDKPLLETYILQQSGRKKPKVCFVGTASGDSDAYTRMFYSAFKKLSCKPSHLSLYKPPLGSLEKYVLEKDVMYVGGGNTRNLLALWKLWGLDRIMKKALNKGIVLCGPSAGSICWFEEGVTDSWPGRLEPLKCLGFLKGSNCPHYDTEKNRRPSYHRLLAQRKIGNGIAADDCVAFHFVDGVLHRVVSSKPDARAFRVGLKKGKAVEKVIVPDYLG
jgi:dipeptidase E